jgi:hypothetical protein
MWCHALKIFTEIENLPAQILHSQKWPNYLPKNQHDIKIYSPAQDDRAKTRASEKTDLRVGHYKKTILAHGYGKKS